MKTVSFEEIKSKLLDLGISSGDGLLVHSAVQYFGKPVGDIGIYYDAIRSIIGAEGTLAVPAFTFSFAISGLFDLKNTPSEKMGVFSEYVRKLPGALRTSHPMQSFALIGKLAEEMSMRDSPSAFDPGSAVGLMIEKDFKILLLGADIQAVSIIHFSEQRLNVPYRYWKDFRGRIKSNGQWIEKTYRMFVRDLNIDPALIIHPIQDELVRLNAWSQVLLNYGTIAVCRMQEFVKVADEMLIRDPWIFVSNYQPGRKEANS
jgi:aminoglycoside 3-N-acetyltransferase